MFSSFPVFGSWRRGFHVSVTVVKTQRILQFLPVMSQVAGRGGCYSPRTGSGLGWAVWRPPRFSDYSCLGHYLDMAAGTGRCLPRRGTHPLLGKLHPVGLTGCLPAHREGWSRGPREGAGMTEGGCLHWHQVPGSGPPLSFHSPAPAGLFHAWPGTDWAGK